MNDYKELIKILGGLCSVKDYEQCEYIIEAADAIEELVAKCHQLEKERDAAIRDMREYLDCGVCKYNTDEYLENGWCRECSVGKSTREHWEWRGVDE